VLRLLICTCVVRFLFEVQLHSKVNKMNIENLATVMGVNLLKPQIEDPFTMMKGENRFHFSHVPLYTETSLKSCIKLNTLYHIMLILLDDGMPPSFCSLCCIKNKHLISTTKET